MINKKFKLFFWGFSCFLLNACSGDNTDLINFINDAKLKKVRPIEPIPKFAPLPVFKFPENDNRRNPFKPIVRKRDDAFAPDQKRKKQPLEAYSLDALQFVGTLKEGTDTWGLIRIPDKQIVRVRVGEYMGQNYGRIVSISNNTIKLEETIKNAGEWEKRTTTINLYTGK